MIFTDPQHFTRCTKKKYICDFYYNNPRYRNSQLRWNTKKTRTICTYKVDARHWEWNNIPLKRKKISTSEQSIRTRPTNSMQGGEKEPTWTYWRSQDVKKNYERKTSASNRIIRIESFEFAPVQIRFEYNRMESNSNYSIRLEALRKIYFI